MKYKIINFSKLNLWDISTISIYFIITSYVSYISLNCIESQKHIVSMYAFLTPLFLYLYNYKSLRNTTVFIIWVLFSFFHIWLYFKIINKIEFKFYDGHAGNGLIYTWAFLIYFQIVRILHLKIKKVELVAPAWGSSTDDFDERKIKFLDYLFFLIFIISWVMIIPILYN